MTDDAFTAARREQLVRASQRSRQVREKNKQVREAIRRGKISAERTVKGTLPEPLGTEVESIVGRWKVEKLLRTVPQMGHQRVLQVLGAARLSANARVDTLSYEKRSDLWRLVSAATGTTV